MVSFNFGVVNDKTSWRLCLTATPSSSRNLYHNLVKWLSMSPLIPWWLNSTKENMKNYSVTTVFHQIKNQLPLHGKKDWSSISSALPLAQSRTPSLARSNFKSMHPRKSLQWLRPAPVFYHDYQSSTVYYWCSDVFGFVISCCQKQLGPPSQQQRNEACILSWHYCRLQRKKKNQATQTNTESDSKPAAMLEELAKLALEVPK